MKQNKLGTGIDTISSLKKIFLWPTYFYFCVQIFGVHDHSDHMLYLIINIYFPHLDATSPFWMTSSWF